MGIVNRAKSFEKDFTRVWSITDGWNQPKASVVSHMECSKNQSIPYFNYIL